MSHLEAIEVVSSISLFAAPIFFILNPGKPPTLLEFEMTTKDYSYACSLKKVQIF